MAAGKFKVHNRTWLRNGDSTFNYTANTFKMILLASTSNITLSVGTGLYGDLTGELATANGYTSGGITLTGVTWTGTAGTVTLTCTAPVWTATGTLTWRWWAIYASGTLNGQVNPLVGFALADTTPADSTTTAGNTLTITPNASGLYTNSGAQID